MSETKTPLGWYNYHKRRGKRYEIKTNSQHELWSKQITQEEFEQIAV